LNQFFDILSIFSLLIFIFIVFSNLEEGILFGILIKPLIDTSWDINFGGLRVIEAFTALFLIFAIIYCFRNRDKILNDKLLTLFWIIAHLGIVFQFVISPMDAIKSLMKMLYLPLSIVLLPYLLLKTDYSVRVKLIKYIIFGSLFSALISVFQFIGLIPYEYAHMSKGLQRSNGFYHDMVTSRIYIMQGLLALAFVKITEVVKFKPFISWLILLVFVFSGYTLFSKALIGMFLIGLLLIIFTLKQKSQNYAIGIFLFFLFVSTNLDSVVNTTSTLFLTEIEYQEGDLDNSGQLLSGRGTVWEEHLHFFSNTSTIEQFFGTGNNTGNTHNEFLRILVLTGVIGVVFYILFVLRIIYLSLMNIRSNMVFLSSLAFSMLLIDIVGVVWGLYPFYLLIIFGFFIVSIQYKEEEFYDYSEEEELD
jgi:hypothetical protein